MPPHPPERASHCLCVLVLRPCPSLCASPQNGFFANAGPLDIFVSQYGLPSDLKFDTSGSSGTPMLHSAEEDVRIEIGTEVRIKLVGIRMAPDHIAVLGTIKEDFLG